MSYRDDLDAAHARISSLEVELASEREAAQKAREQLDGERKERRRLEALLGSRNLEPVTKDEAPRQKPRTSVWVKEPEYEVVGVVLTLAVALGLVLFVVALLVR